MAVGVAVGLDDNVSSLCALPNATRLRDVALRKSLGVMLNGSVCSSRSVGNRWRTVGGERKS